MKQPEHDLRPFQTSTASPRRLVSVGAVALLHVVVIWALATGLASQIMQKLPEEIKAEVVQEKPPETPKTPPPPPPELQKPPPPYVPPPDINLQTEAPVTAPTQITTTITPPPPPVTKPAPPPITAPVLAAGSGNTCLSRYYPAMAIRLSHEGATLVTVHVSASGDVENVDVAQGSGHDELDQAAVKCVTSGWRFKPALQNGQPVAGVKQYRIVWKLTG
jgi:protein TonB